jgi:hypothetical protein
MKNVFPIIILIVLLLGFVVFVLKKIKFKNKKNKIREEIERESKILIDETQEKEAQEKEAQDFINAKNSFLICQN